MPWNFYDKRSRKNSTKQTKIEMGQEQYFKYGKTEIEWLKSRDKRMAEAIERIGRMERTVIPDLFAALVHSIIGQQISTKMHEKIWSNMQKTLNGITAEKIEQTSRDNLQKFGITFKKADWIKSAAHKVLTGEFDIRHISDLNDNEAIDALIKLDGIGVWSAEMLLLFSMQRQNILSFGDLAIQRGMRMIFHHRKITKELFEKYRRRFSPYCSVASIYFWAVASGKYNGYKDYAPKYRKPNGK